MSWQAVAQHHLQQTRGQLTLDSRALHPGDVFVALPGQVTDGRDYLAAALALPSVLVLAEATAAERFAGWREHSAIVWVANLRVQLGAFLRECFGSAARSAMALLGVTGTNGKTSVSHFLAQALSSEAPCGVLGTIGQGLWPHLQDTTNTTLDVISNHRVLADFAAQGARHAVMEVSSHALDQGRVDGLRYQVALFTNLTHDHLDYHGTMSHYFAAKRQLFTTERAEQVAVCIDDDWGQQLATWRADALTVSGTLGAAAVAPSQLQMMDTGIAADWQTPWGVMSTQTQVLGAFNVANLALVIASLGLLGWSVQRIADQVSKLQPITGRMQCVTLSDQRLAIIDYAHTPDALRQALSAARQHTQGRLHCVFGCGGDRDRAKRAPMGQIAETHADQVWLTSDNNRTELFSKISADVLSGMANTKGVAVIADRAQAIAEAVSALHPGDVVLIAGKGHEQYQEEQGQRVSFSDVAVVQSLQERKP